MDEMKLKNHNRLRTWVEIDKSKARENYKLFKAYLGPDVKLAAVTKSNAYGHGLVEYSKLMESFGADMICVDSIMEARELRLQGVKIPILVMGYTLPINFDAAKEHDITLAVSSLENLKQIVGYHGVAFHLKFDTGFNRQGFTKNELEEAAGLLKNNTENLTGVFTHFANAKVPSQREKTDRQLDDFKPIADKIKSLKPGLLVHAGATAGALIYPEARFDMVRVGIGLYGLWPDEPVRQAYQDKLKLKPVLSWKTIVSEVKRARKGGGVGYRHTSVLERDSNLAVCPVGYWHGYLRALSNKSAVLIRGKRAPLRGNVSMGMMVVDVTEIKDVRAGDEAVLIGEQGAETVTADELANLAGTINYEIVTRINPYSKRYYL